MIKVIPYLSKSIFRIMHQRTVIVRNFGYHIFFKSFTIFFFNLKKIVFGTFFNIFKIDFYIVVSIIPLVFMLKA